MSSHIEDNEIRARLDKKDPSALEMIWNLYASDLLGYLVSLYCSRREAEDTLQDVFVAIARKREAVARARRLKPYLFRLARNTALNQMKKNRRDRERIREAAEWLAPLEEDREATGKSGEVEQALALLPTRQRVVIVLKIYREMSFREIAALLGIPANTAASRYRYGMEKLRILLGEEAS